MTLGTPVRRLGRKRRHAVHLLMWSAILPAAACSTSPAGPALLPSSAALASQQVALAVGADTTIDPAANSACVTFAANLSAVHSVEYLPVTQSGATTSGPSA